MEAGHFLSVANCVYENMSVSEMGRPRKPGTRNLYSRERMADRDRVGRTPGSPWNYQENCQWGTLSGRDRQRGKLSVTLGS